jgi:hypothetical protein
VIANGDEVNTIAARHSQLVDIGLSRGDHRAGVRSVTANDVKRPKLISEFAVDGVKIETQVMWAIGADASARSAGGLHSGAFGHERSPVILFRSAARKNTTAQARCARQYCMHANWSSPDFVDTIASTLGLRQRTP